LLKARHHTHDGSTRSETIETGYPMLKMNWPHRGGEGRKKKAVSGGPGGGGIKKNKVKGGGRKRGQKDRDSRGAPRARNCTQTHSSGNRKTQYHHYWNLLVA